MSKEITFRVSNARKVSFGVMSCDINIGVTEGDKFIGMFTVPDFILKKNEKGYYYQEPSKPYIKNGEHQVDDQGYKRYLKFFKLYEEKGAGQDPEKYAATKDAFAARSHLIDLMVEKAKSLGWLEGATTTTAKRSAPARTTRQAPPASAKTTIEENEGSSPFGEDDDSIPF